MLPQWLVLAGIAVGMAIALTVQKTSDPSWRVMDESVGKVVVVSLLGGTGVTLLSAGAVVFGEAIAGGKTLFGRTVTPLADDTIAAVVVLTGVYMSRREPVNADDAPLSRGTMQSIYAVFGIGVAVAALVTLLL
ncbi:hypothetical protein [Haloarchaeobius sp. TZWWS8]|uniref:hypothetical protein n=1 Tax=Haloarchaeobius sp. TZWWS8 TaxID=3446121 RepID=UPI003EB74D74